VLPESLVGAFGMHWPEVFRRIFRIRVLAKLEIPMRALMATAPLLTAVALALPFVEAIAQDAPTKQQVIDAVAGAEVTHLTATVEAVDMKTRTVTLRGPRGNAVDLQAGPEVKNLAQVKVGDKVEVDYMESLGLALKRGENLRTREETTSVTVPKGPQKPHGQIVRKVTMTASVLDLDQTNQTVRLQGPKGKVRDVKVKDPKVLEDVKVGDTVQVTYIEGVAIRVKPGNASQ
jgi:hypothetical protein